MVSKIAVKNSVCVNPNDRPAENFVASVPHIRGPFRTYEFYRSHDWHVLKVESI